MDEQKKLGQILVDIGVTLSKVLPLIGERVVNADSIEIVEDVSGTTGDVDADPSIHGMLGPFVLLAISTNNVVTNAWNFVIERKTKGRLEELKSFKDTAIDAAKTAVAQLRKLGDLLDGGQEDTIVELLPGYEKLIKNARSIEISKPRASARVVVGGWGPDSLELDAELDVENRCVSIRLHGIDDSYLAEYGSVENKVVMEFGALTLIEWAFGSSFGLAGELVQYVVERNSAYEVQQDLEITIESNGGIVADIEIGESESTKLAIFAKSTPPVKNTSIKLLHNPIGNIENWIKFYKTVINIIAQQDRMIVTDALVAYVDWFEGADDSAVEAEIQHIVDGSDTYLSYTRDRKETMSTIIKHLKEIESDMEALKLSDVTGPVGEIIGASSIGGADASDDDVAIVAEGVDEANSGDVDEANSDAVGDIDGVNTHTIKLSAEQIEKIKLIILPYAESLAPVAEKINSMLTFIDDLISPGVVQTCIKRITVIYKIFLLHDLCSRSKTVDKRLVEVHGKAIEAFGDQKIYGKNGLNYAALGDYLV